MNPLRPRYCVLLAVLACSVLVSCKTKFECALGDMGEGCSVWGWWFFFQYDDDDESAAFQAVAVGANSRVYSSADGINWTANQVASSTQYTLNAVAYTGSRFVAVGQDTATSLETIWYSADAQTWTQATIGTPCTVIAQLNDVMYQSGRLIAVGSATSGTIPCIQVSTDDGTTWTPGSLTLGPSTLYRVASDGTNFFAAGPQPSAANVRVSMSTDGVNFNAEPDTDPIDSGSTGKGGNQVSEMSMVPGTGKVYLLGSEELGTPIARSVVLGASNQWTPYDSPSIFGGNTIVEYPRGIASDGSTLVAVGDNCRYDSTANLAAPAWSGLNQTIGGCSGVTWRRLVYANGKFIAIGYDGSSNAVIGVSATGAVSDWTLQTLSAGQLNGVAHNR